MLGIIFRPSRSPENLIVFKKRKTNGLAKSVKNFTDSEMHLPAITFFLWKSIFKVECFLNSK